MIRDYFNTVKLWKIVVLNIIVGMILSVPLFIGVILIFGLFNPPSITSQLQGTAILLGIIIGIILNNYVLWRMDQRIKKVNSVDTSDNESSHHEIINEQKVNIRESKGYDIAIIILLFIGILILRNVVI